MSWLLIIFYQFLLFIRSEAFFFSLFNQNKAGWRRPVNQNTPSYYDQSYRQTSSPAYSDYYENYRNWYYNQYPTSRPYNVMDRDAPRSLPAMSPSNNYYSNYNYGFNYPSNSWNSNNNQFSYGNQGFNYGNSPFSYSNRGNYGNFGNRWSENLYSNRQMTNFERPPYRPSIYRRPYPVNFYQYQNQNNKPQTRIEQIFGETTTQPMIDLSRIGSLESTTESQTTTFLPTTSQIKKDEFVQGSTEVSENSKPKSSESHGGFGDYEDTIKQEEKEKTIRKKPPNKKLSATTEPPKAYEFHKQRDQKVLENNENQRLTISAEYVPIGHDTDPEQRLYTGVVKKKIRGWKIIWDNDKQK